MPVGQQVTRRSLLRAAAAGAVGVAAGCTSEVGSPRPAPATSTASSSRPAEPPDWAALRKKLRGGLVLPADDGYAAAAQVYNPLFDGRRPAAIARCERPEDVQACVEAAAAARFPIAARSGGHSYAGYSNQDEALIVDLGPMSAVNPRGPRAEIGAGARLIDVYAGLSVEGRCVPAGSCPSVGIAGLTLGGGIGVLSRKYGLTCDLLESAQVVKADGSLVTASLESEPDLFWALRGGGGGNFGIVTSFTFNTVVAPALTVFALRFPAGSAADVVEAWQNWADGVAEMWSNCVVSAGSPPSVRVGGCFVGSPELCRIHLNRFFALAPAPTSELVTAKSYLDTMRHFAGCSDRSVEQCRPAAQGGELDRSSFVASSRILAKPVSDPAALVSLLDGRSELDLMLDSLGGEVSFTRPEQTAFPHRDALASVQIYANATAGRQSATRQVREVLESLGRLAGQLGYVNYIDPNMPNWESAYYGGNISRLQDIAARYDPDGVFAFAQGIKPR
ncbi:MAG: FAD-binding oxidoreductase [Actinophytocola sp.]|uniref:FAD-binding oxidoreductase n=1 Tax=Actinophytocola sp. TaxID=1872138 RepID=UPI003D6B1332